MSDPEFRRGRLVVVTGLPRSGTSMAMRMLGAGGLRLVDDGRRAPSPDNPHGWFEDERVRRLRADASWLRAELGAAVKIVLPLASALPDDLPCDFVWMRRPVREVLASQERMLGRGGEERGSEVLERAFERACAAFARRGADGRHVVELDYPFGSRVSGARGRRARRPRRRAVRPRRGRARGGRLARPLDAAVRPPGSPHGIGGVPGSDRAPESLPREPGTRTVVVTGGTDGIGRAAARGLAARGLRVILLARDDDRGAKAAAEIAAEAGNPNVEHVFGDLSRMASVRAAAAEILRRAPRLDVLVNNAAATFSDFGLTGDGIERTAATNHVGPFLLTALLLDALRAAQAGRVVNVASNGHRRTELDLAAFTRDDGHFVLRAYDRSKLANVLFTVELAERLRGTSVTANCLHPGRIATRIGEKDGMRGPHRLAWRAVSRLTGHGPEAGARPVIHLAVSDEVAGSSGRYFTGFSALANRPLARIREERMHACAGDRELRCRLWELSERLSGARFPAWCSPVVSASA